MTILTLYTHGEKFLAAFENIIIKYYYKYINIKYYYKY